MTWAGETANKPVQSGGLVPLVCCSQHRSVGRLVCLPRPLSHLHEVRMPKFEITLVFEAESAEAAAAAVENATFFNEPIAVTAPELVQDGPEDDGKPLTDRLKAELLADFRSWTGGFDPWECDEDEVKEYGSCDKDHRYLEQCRVAGHA